MADSDDAATVHTVTITLRTRDPDLAPDLAIFSANWATDIVKRNPAVDWGVDTDRYQESQAALPPVRLHDSDIRAIAERVRGETEPVS